jgi:hypothetical protein
MNTVIGPAIGINCEFKIYGITGVWTEYRRIEGNTGDEIRERAAAWAKVINAVDWHAVGIHNMRGDWEEAFGKIEEGKKYTFADDAPPIQWTPPESRWSRFMRFVGLHRGDAS